MSTRRKAILEVIRHLGQNTASRELAGPSPSCMDVGLLHSNAQRRDVVGRAGVDTDLAFARRVQHSCLQLENDQIDAPRSMVIAGDF